jgi:hypothetical protein
MKNWKTMLSGAIFFIASASIAADKAPWFLTHTWVIDLSHWIVAGSGLSVAYFAKDKDVTGGTRQQ